MELDDFIDFDGVFNVDDLLEFNNLLDLEVLVDDSYVFVFINYLYFLIFEFYWMFDVDIINVISGECILFVKIIICFEKIEVVFVLCNC